MIRATILGLALFLGFFNASNSQAAVAVAQTCTSTVALTTSDATCTFTPLSTSNLLVVLTVTGNGTVNSLGGVSGTGGCSNAFTNLTANGTSVGAFTAVPSSTASCTITFAHGTQTAVDKAIFVYEVSGWNGTTRVDTAWVTTAGSGGSLTQSMGTTTPAIDLLLGVATTVNTGANIPSYTTPQAGFTTDLSITGGTQINAKTEKQITVSSGTYTCGWSTISNISARTIELGCVGIKGVATSPTIESTNPTPSVAEGSTLTLGGQLLKAGGNSTVTFGGVSQTVTVQSISAPQITVSLGNNKFGSCQGTTQTGLPLILTDSAAAVSNTYSTAGIVPASGYECVDLVGTLVSSGSRITATCGGAVDCLVAGDQLAYETKGTCGLVNCVIVYPDGSFSVDPSVTSFQVRGWHDTTSGYGAYSTQTVNSANPSYTMFF